MIGQASLTRGEFQLMCAAVGAPVLPGLDGLALREDAPPPQSTDRSGLLSKGLLEVDNGGHFEVNPAAGYLYSRMADCSAWLRMDMAFVDGTATRKVLYLVDDAFVLVDWRSTNEIAYTYMATIPEAMGTLLSIIHNESKNGMPFEEVLMDDPTAPMVLTDSLRQGIASQVAVHLVTEGAEMGFGGTDVSFVVDANGALYKDLKNVDGSDFRREPIEKLVGPVSEKVLTVHRARIIAKQRSEASPDV